MSSMVLWSSLVVAITAPLAAVTAPSIALPVTAPSTIRQHAIELRDRGFTVIPECVSRDATLLESARKACTTTLASNLKDVEVLGCDSVEQGWSFPEICHRSRLRYDYRFTAAATAEVQEATVEAAAPIITALHRMEPALNDGRQLWPRRLSPRDPKTLMSGCIMSRTGAAQQILHRDSTPSDLRKSALLPSHRLFNAFVPLIDIDASGAGTEFWPGSHHTQAWRHWLNADDAERWRLFSGATMEAPACPAGGLILFDFRVMHRGLANPGQDRPYVYTVLGTGWARDTHNFPEHPRLRACVEQLPTDPELLDLTRRTIRKAKPFWNEMDAVIS